VVPARTHVMVAEVVWNHFHHRWRQIEREWRSGAMTLDEMQSPGMFEAIALGINAARDELRAEVGSLAKDFPGSYLVPV
jgi:hypothetical protein